MATYATLPQFIDYLRTSGDETDSDLYELALAASEEAVDMAMGTTGAQLDPVPSMVTLAVLIQASRWVKRRDAPFGIAGSPDMGSEMRLLARLDPDVEVLIRGYGELPRLGGTT